jgi:hypothetical protein
MIMSTPTASPDTERDQTAHLYEVLRAMPHAGTLPTGDLLRLCRGVVRRLAILPGRVNFSEPSGSQRPANL